MDSNKVFDFILNRHHSTVEAQIQFRPSLYGSYNKLSALEQVFLQVPRFSLASIIPPVPHTHHFYATLIKNTKGRSLGTQNQYTFLQSGDNG